MKRLLITIILYASFVAGAKAQADINVSPSSRVSTLLTDERYELVQSILEVKIFLVDKYA